MKRRITQVRSFSIHLDEFIKKRKISEKDFEDFKKNLVENPEQGDPISSTGGVRKTRIKSLSKGKRGGFRICYYYDSAEEEIFLILIYAKNEQEDLSQDEKKTLKKFTDIVKRGRL